jgi:hypothetical protein
VKILRARATRHFLFLLVRCRCGKQFGHRADRPNIICYECGRMAALRDLRPRHAKADRAAGKASSAPARASAAKAGKPTRPAARQTAGSAHTVRRSVPAPAKRRATR